MRKKFNNVKAYHGSDAVSAGKLKGATDTDYFYFFCPLCQNNEILRILDYEIRLEEDKSEFRYRDIVQPSPETCFVIAFKLRCQKCGLEDFVKVGNIGWQGGKYADALRKFT